VIRRILAGFGLATAGIAVTAIGQIVAVPVLLARWGPQLYGEWVTLTALAGSLSILNLGVQTYVGNRLIAFHIRGETALGTADLHAGLRLYLGSCTAAMLATAGLVAWPGVLEWLRISAMPTGEARLILGIQGLLATYAIVGGLLLSLFRVTGQLPRQLAYGLVERIVIVGVPVIVALAGGQPVQVALVSIVCLVGIAVAAVGDVRRRSPFRIGLSESSWRASFALILPSAMFFGSAAASPLLSSGVIVLISTNVGGTAVAAFTTTLVLSNMLRVIINQGLIVIWPEITAAAAVGDDVRRLARWHRLALKVAGLVLAIGFSGLVLLGPDVLAAWTMGRLAVDPGLNLLLAIYLVVQGPALVGGVFGLATNHPAGILAIQVATATISLGAGMEIVPAFHARGAAVALILGQLAGTVGTLWVVCRWTCDPGWGLVRDTFLRSAPTVTTIALGTGATTLVFSGLGGHMLGLIMVAGTAVWTGWRTWLTTAERAVLSTGVNAMLVGRGGGVRAEGASV